METIFKTPEEKINLTILIVSYVLLLCVILVLLSHTNETSGEVLRKHDTTITETLKE